MDQVTSTFLVTVSAQIEECMELVQIREVKVNL